MSPNAQSSAHEPRAAASSAPGDPTAHERDAPRMPVERLRGLERLAAPALDRLNGNTALKDFTRPFWRYVGKNFVTSLSANLYELHGLEHVRELIAPEGVVVVANHRSFFDLFFTAAVLVDHAPQLARRMIFPVRKNYFYDTLPGLLLNLTITSGSMWPPIFRDERKGELNPIAMAQIGAVMQRGTLVGIHPEGRRGVGPDPYELQPIKVGVGQLLNGAHPDVLVLPVFILGAGNDVLDVIRRNRRPPGQRGEPVRIRFGAPMRAGDLVADADGDPLRIAEATMAPVRALAAVDEATRAAATAAR
jgi:1-acyl-sn-glycerol-3-phosphate acyltransferase